jgi:hypothetical protein
MTNAAATLRQRIAGVARFDIVARPTVGSTPTASTPLPAAQDRATR